MSQPRELPAGRTECALCKGRGTCHACGDKGFYYVKKNDQSGKRFGGIDFRSNDYIQTPCHMCAGRGICPTCGGKGWT